MESAKRKAITGVWGQSPWSGGQGGEAPLKLTAFSWMYVPRLRQISPFLMFEVKRRKMIFKHRHTTNIRAVMLSLALVLSLVVLKDQISVLGPGLGLEGAVLAKDSTKDQGQRQHH